MNKRIWRLGLAAAAVAAVVVIGIVLLTGNDTGAQLSPSSASTVASSPSPGHTAPAEGLAEGFGFGDGVYLVGTDIPAGLYRGITVSDAGGLCQIASDANGSSIIASDRATSGQFYVQVKQGQYLKLSGVQIVNAAAAAPTKMRSSVGGDGVYLVGTDIPAGRYRGRRRLNSATRTFHATRTAPSATRPAWSGRVATSILTSRRASTSSCSASRSDESSEQEMPHATPTLFKRQEVSMSSLSSSTSGAARVIETLRTSSRRLMFAAVAVLLAGAVAGCPPAALRCLPRRAHPVPPPPRQPRRRCPVRARPCRSRPEPTP